MIVYTAIFGGYDRPQPHLSHHLVDRWICYTDDPDLDAPGWEVLYETGRYPHPRLSAKWWKCHPPQGSDTTLWVDGQIVFNDIGFIDVVADCLSRSDMTLWAHPQRDDITEEAEVSSRMLKYDRLDVHGQVRRYTEAGWPAHGGLWASTVIGRRNTPAVLQMGAAWFAHNELLTYQDQLSLPPILAAYTINPEPLPQSLWNNQWLGFAGHNSDL